MDYQFEEKKNEEKHHSNDPIKILSAAKNVDGKKKIAPYE